MKKSTIYTNDDAIFRNKKDYQDALVFIAWHFWIIFEDAKTASKELELVLTGRDAGAKERVPMCVPYHAVNSYLEN